MNSMFKNAAAFNGDILAWNVNAVTEMQEIFSGATSFNQDITGWTPESSVASSNMYYGASTWLSAYTNCGYNSLSRHLLNADVCLGETYESSSSPTSGPPGAWTSTCGTCGGCYADMGFNAPPTVGCALICLCQLNFHATKFEHRGLGGITSFGFWFSQSRYPAFLLPPVRYPSSKPRVL